MSVIKLTNGVQISQTSIDGITGIDFNNIIASASNQTSNVSYTATQDSFIVVDTYQNSSIFIDGIQMFGGYTASAHCYGSYILKKGQVFTYPGGDGRWNGCAYKVYGLKK